MGVELCLDFYCYISKMLCYYRPRSLAKQGDNALGSVRPSVRLCVCALTAEPQICGIEESLQVIGVCLCVCEQ